jgi:hypothetical protein
MDSAELEKAFQAAQSFALIPILRLLKDSLSFENNTGVDDTKEPGNISLRSNDDHIVAKLEKVPNDYSIMESFNRAFGKSYTTFEAEEADTTSDTNLKEMAIGVIVHLMKSAHIVFSKLRDEPALAEHQLEMDSNTKIHLTGYSEFLSVTFNLESRCD